MITEKQLPHMLKLLDDDEPAIQAALREEFSHSSGDLSNELAALNIDLIPAEQRKLSQLLQPGRRDTLIKEWIAPQGGAKAVDEDWETFESLMRVISDFLHDGVTLRPTLPDLLDMLADEAEDEITELSANNLRKWLFESGKLQGNREGYYQPENSDLAAVIDTGLGNPISLATVFMLVAKRLNLEVSGCNYPGHFLARIHLDGRAVLVDCFHDGRLIPVDEILHHHKEISDYAKLSVATEASLGHILCRSLRNLEYCFKKLDQKQDATLFLKLFNSLDPGE